MPGLDLRKATRVSIGQKEVQRLRIGAVSWYRLLPLPAGLIYFQDDQNVFSDDAASIPAQIGDRVAVWRRVGAVAQETSEFYQTDPSLRPMLTAAGVDLSTGTWMRRRSKIGLFRSTIGLRWTNTIDGSGWIIGETRGTPPVGGNRSFGLTASNGQLRLNIQQGSSDIAALAFTLQDKKTLLIRFDLDAGAAVIANTDTTFAFNIGNQATSILTIGDGRGAAVGMTVSRFVCDPVRHASADLQSILIWLNE